VARRARFTALLGLLLLASTSARAAALWEATWLQVTQGVPMTRTFHELGASGGIFNSGASIGVWLSYPAFATTLFVPKTPNGTLTLAYQISQGGPQFIFATSKLGTGSPGVPGTVVLKTAAHAGMGVNASMFMVGTNTLLAVPLGHGQQGRFTDTQTVLSLPPIYVTVDFYAWSPGTFLFTGLTSNGLPLPDASAMGNWHVDGLQQGFVTLVAPSKVSIDGLIQRRTVSFTTLRLEFPEPGTWFLLGAAAGGMALAARRRRCP
jgi:hypothetical protein